LRNLIPVLSNLIATLYSDAGPESTYWKSAYPRQDKNLISQNINGRGRRVCE
jgi:hypothetical protein